MRRNRPTTTVVSEFLGGYVGDVLIPRRIGTHDMWNIIIGAVFLIGGLSGRIAIRGTDSTVGASILGGVLIVWGIIQMVRANSSEE